MHGKILGAFHWLKNHPNAWLRMGAGFAFILAGLLGPFLPILGTWMLPLGIVLLAVDIPWLRPVSRWMHRRWEATERWVARLRHRPERRSPQDGDRSPRSPSDF